jgi:hypothetical protein
MTGPPGPLVRRYGQFDACEDAVALDPAEHAPAAHHDGAERDDTPELVRADAASVGPGYVLGGTGLQELPRPASLAMCPLKKVTTT